ncbi:MAG: glycosyltransferase family 39 protein [Candidatus Eiseniibacteriota bacterium]
MSAAPVYDELWWMRIADRGDLLHGHQHPPGQVWWSTLGTLVCGKNLLGYRLLSLLFGAATVWAVWQVGRRLAGPVAGVTAAWLLTLNEYHLGASHLATEKNYLAFAAFTLLLADEVARKPTSSRFAALGLALGLGLATKQSLALWVPPLAVAVFALGGRAALLRTRGPWIAAAVALVCVMPDVIWNLRAPAAALAADEAELGFAYQLEKLRPGTWSFGPMALYVRPLYFHKVEPSISEYPAMTTLPGCLVLAGALASLVVLRSGRARVLQVLGFGTFLFFSLASSPKGEFWWADLSLLCFLPLAAGVAASVPRGANIACALLVAAMVLPAWRTFAVRDNLYRLDWAAPRGLPVERFRNSQRFLFTEFRDRDHAALYRLGGLELPAARMYADGVRAYAEHLADERRALSSDSVYRGFPKVTPQGLEAEREWAAMRVAELDPTGGTPRL